MSRLVSMPTAVLDNSFPHPGEGPLEALLKREEERAGDPTNEVPVVAKPDARKSHVVRAWNELGYRERGCIAALLHDICGHSYADIAQFFGCSEVALRVAKARAHDSYCCGKPLAECTQMVGPLQNRGVELLEELKDRVLSELIAKADNEAGGKR